MNAYGYYKKGNDGQYILTWPSESIDSAKEKFASLKGISLQEFNSIYEVEKVDIFNLS